MAAKKVCLLGALCLTLASGRVRGGIISGYVYQVDGQPVIGATIEAVRLDTEEWSEATTGFDGSYQVANLPIGDYKVRASKPGFAREYYDNVAYSNEATIIRITSAGEISGIDFHLTEGGAISGRVTYDETGAPITDVEIIVVPSGEGTDYMFRAVTGSDGSYTVECLPLGAYRVRAHCPGFTGLWYEHGYSDGFATDITVTPPDTVTDIDFSLSRGGSISGFVTDARGIGIRAATVRAGAELPNGDWFGNSVETGTRGNYIITGLPAGDHYRVTVRKAGFAPEWYDSKITGTTADNVAVTAASRTAGINFTLDVAGSITGHVYDEEDGTPIPGIEFLGYLASGEGLDVLGITAYDGSYTLWLRTGEYWISANSSGRGGKYIHEWYDNSYGEEDATEIQVVAPHETSGIDFYLSKAGSISGHIYSDTGEPISDASVYAFSDIYPGGGANSQSDGRYTIDGLPSGSYTVQVSVTGYISESNTGVVVTAPHDTPDIRFALMRTTSADFDMDARADFVDYAVLANHWMNHNCSEPDWCGGTDFTHDGDVDFDDLKEWVPNWLAGVGIGSHATGDQE